MESYLPRWVFDGPDHLYFRLERKIKSDFENLLENLLALDKENVSREKINPIALSLILNQFPPEKWMSDLSQREIDLLNQIYDSRLNSFFSLPYLFMLILSNFLESISSEENGINPSEYAKLIYVDSQSRTFPLGLIDPLNSIADLIDTLIILWENKRLNLGRFKFFKFNGRGLLQGKSELRDSWTTILAYCGGSKSFVRCGYSPLIIGVEETCNNCGRLICPKCNHCHDSCTRYKQNLTVNGFHQKIAFSTGDIPLISESKNSEFIFNAEDIPF